MAKAKKTPDYWKFATLLLVGFIVGYFVAQVSPSALSGDSTDTEDNAKVIEVNVGGDTGEEKAPTVVEVSAGGNVYLGRDDAPIEIIEFSDYQCSYCQRFHLESFGDLVENYVDTGKVKFVYRDYPLSFHAQAPLASLSAYCAGEQDSFWEMHDQIFMSLSEWSGSAEADQLFVTYAADLGLDVEAFEACLISPEASDEVQNDLIDGLSYGVAATPTFFINGQKLEGAQPYSVFESILDSMLNELE